jgi:hypothetical protein
MKKQKIFSTLFSVLGTTTILAPVVLSVSNCSPFDNVITFNAHDRNLSYETKVMKLSATSTFGTNITLSAKGVGKGDN